MSLSPVNRWKLSLFKPVPPLQEDFSIEDIADSLKYVQNNGTPGSGVHCHTPMAFLACSMDTVLALVNEERQRSEKRAQREQSDALRKRQEEAKQSEFDSKYTRAKQLFMETFPSQGQQEAQFNAFASTCPIYERGSYALKTAAVLHWYSEQKNK